MNDLPLRMELGSLEMFADPIVEKVFYNLVNNTIEHGGEVSEIRMSCQSMDGGLLVIYEDDGRGIPTEEKEKIFEYGYGEGTGFGLFLSREILSVAGMTIKENGIPGKGARFEIMIPGGQFRLSG